MSKVTFYYVSQFCEAYRNYSALGRSVNADLETTKRATYITGITPERARSLKRSAQGNFARMRVNDGEGIRFGKNYLFPNGETMNWNYQKKRDYILNSDMIIFFAGCPHRMKESMIEQGIYEIILEYVNERDKGVIFGVSAGVPVMSEFAITPKTSRAYPETKIDNGFNFVNGISCFPHVDITEGIIPQSINTNTSDGIIEFNDLIDITKKVGPYILLAEESVLRVKESYYNVIGKTPYILDENGNITPVEKEGHVDELKQLIKKLKR